MTDIRTRLADVLRQQIVMQGLLPVHTPQGTKAARNMADALLSLPGIAIVELPDGEDPRIAVANARWEMAAALLAAAAQAQEDQQT